MTSRSFPVFWVALILTVIGSYLADITGLPLAALIAALTIAAWLIERSLSRRSRGKADQAG